MNLLKLTLAIATWCIDDFGIYYGRRKIKNYLESKAPSNPYLYKRITIKTTHDCPQSNQLPLQKRSPLKMTDLKLKPGIWKEGEYYIEEHNSSHLHNDFSIIVNGKVYRLARTPSKENKKAGFMGLFPGPGEKVAWIPQPEHLIKEVPNPPIITEGYGKGTTKVVNKGKCLVNISHSNNMHVIFDGIEGTYIFVEANNGSTLMMRKLHTPINFGKHKMLDKRDVDTYINDPNYIMFAKKDGAGIEWKIVKSATGHKHLQIFSWRPDAKLRKKYGVNTQIEHTQRLKLCDKEVHPNTPLAEGRGEIWCGGPNGLLHVNSILNSLPFKARKQPYNPYLYIHDIVTLEGKKVEHLSPKEKLSIMQSIYQADKRFKIPPHALSSASKKKLWNKCKKEDSVDGVIAWKYNELYAKGIKLKFKHDRENFHPATIVDIVPQEGSNKFGYPILENLQGIQFKSSGVGLTEEVKSDMLKNPDNWIGIGVRYSAERHFNKGTPFQPIIKEWNTE